VHICGDWGFFGVFDGHGGDECAKFVAPRIERELKDRGCPQDDETVRQMMFNIDQEFLETDQESGSTATMCIVHKPVEKGAKHELRVINAGDSRVLLGKRDGTIVDGQGTDKGLTTDHKPDDEVEKERIYRCGGFVETMGGGCARVNGDLAVCRGFGDKKYKNPTECPKPEDRPVTVDPELKRFSCDEADFILLVCDGVSEGDFSNEEVVKLVSKVLEETNDLGIAARAVCFEAVNKNSKDNISCMIVALDGDRDVEKSVEFRPGSVTDLSNSSYRTAYEEMAKRAGLTLAEAVAKRYEMLSGLPQAATSEEADQLVKQFVCGSDEPDSMKVLQSLAAELKDFGSPDGESGSEERIAYFRQWVQKEPPPEQSNDHAMDPFFRYINILDQTQQLPGDQGPLQGGYAK